MPSAAPQPDAPQSPTLAGIVRKALDFIFKTNKYEYDSEDDTEAIRGQRSAGVRPDGARRDSAAGRKRQANGLPMRAPVHQLVEVDFIEIFVGARHVGPAPSQRKIHCWSRVR